MHSVLVNLAMGVAAAAAGEDVRCSICNALRFRNRNIKQLWHKLAGGGEKKPHCGVPPGHLAIAVGSAAKRFVIKASYLNHPLFRQLLDLVYEEYGHNCDGPLTIPCDEFVFQEIIQSVRDCQGMKKYCCSCQEKRPRAGLWTDSRPFLHGFVQRMTR